VNDYKNIKLNGLPTAYLQVSPAKTVNLTFDWTGVNPSNYCPGCLRQDYVGWAGLDEKPACYQKSNAHGASGTFNHVFTAPSTPGIYFLSMSPLQLQNKCYDEELLVLDDQRFFLAAICVK
jgi:hypothetical protein